MFSNVFTSNAWDPCFRLLSLIMNLLKSSKSKTVFAIAIHWESERQNRHLHDRVKDYFKQSPPRKLPDAIIELCKIS